ncbi:MAG: hypothetical protein K8R53_04145, partial [Bacteroidales bacterium]|nr:hypothetical protein [Bacteroidales bacterium]
SLFSGNIELAIVQLQKSFDIERYQKNPNYQKLAHKQLNLAVAFLVNNDHSKALKHLKSGWNYKSITNRIDHRNIRLLMVRIVAAFLRDEDYKLFVGQLITLLDEYILTAAGINIKWSLEDLLSDLVSNCTVEKIKLWDLLCKAIYAKLHSGLKVDICVFEGFKKYAISEDWP